MGLSGRAALCAVPVAPFKTTSRTAWRVGVKPWAGLVFITAVYLL